jgi:V/A-type H+-transporting ATPase subunit K
MKRGKGRWIVAAAACGILAVAGMAMAQEQTAANPASGEPGAMKSAAIAIAIGIMMGISIVGSGLAVGRIGAAAMGAAAEKPELLTRSLLFVALAEGLAVLAFVVAMIMVGKM